MTLSLYEITIPVYIRALTQLSKVLQKAVDHADEKGISHSELFNARLAPEMQPLPFQIQRVSDLAKFVVVRVAGQERVTMEDNEKTFEELQARIQKTIDVLKKVKVEDMQGKEDSEVVMPVAGKEATLTGRDFVLIFATPNLYFHVVSGSHRSSFLW